MKNLSGVLSLLALASMVGGCSGKNTDPCASIRCSDATPLCDGGKGTPTCKCSATPRDSCGAGSQCLEGACQSIDLCAGAGCHVGETCDPADGLCKCTGSPGQGSCPTDRTCGATLRCVSATGENTEPCATIRCSDRTPLCDDSGGTPTCKCSATPRDSCGAGSQCLDGACQNIDLCAGASCGGGEACDPADGFCKCTGSPGQGSCPTDQVCSAMLRCVSATDPCANVTCSGTTPVCEQGRCVCTGTSCGRGFICSLGACESEVCPPNQVCAGESGVDCCTGDKVCSGGQHAHCYTPSCDPTSPTACPTDQSCYYDAAVNRYKCADQGSGLVGSSCQADADCLPGYGCSEASGTCAKHCCVGGLEVCFDVCLKCDANAAGAGCGAGEYCVGEEKSATPYGTCTCTQHDRCGSSCCATKTQYCDTSGTTPACRDLVPCDPLNPTACAGDEGCFRDMAVDGKFFCFKAGGALPGASCVSDGDCPATYGCNAFARCARFCSQWITGACSGAEHCIVDSASGSGLCTSCPSSQACGPACCDRASVCDATGPSPTCKTISCDPLGPSACSADRGCYSTYSASTKDSGYLCALKGSGLPVSSCMADFDCAPGYGCDIPGFQCAQYCDPAGTNTCPSGRQCGHQVQRGVGFYGFCVF